MAIGNGRGRLPLITERSEWHRPAAPILINTSPGPGGSRSISSILSGWLAAYGNSAPMQRRTSLLIFMAAYSSFRGPRLPAVQPCDHPPDRLTLPLLVQ